MQPARRTERLRVAMTTLRGGPSRLTRSRAARQGGRDSSPSRCGRLDTTGARHATASPLEPVSFHRLGDHRFHDGPEIGWPDPGCGQRCENQANGTLVKSNQQLHSAVALIACRPIDARPRLT